MVVVVGTLRGLFNTIFRIIVATIKLKKIGEVATKQVRDCTTKICYVTTYSKNILCPEMEVVSTKNSDKTIVVTYSINRRRMKQLKVEANH